MRHEYMFKTGLQVSVHVCEHMCERERERTCLEGVNVCMSQPACVWVCV